MLRQLLDWFARRPLLADGLLTAALWPLALTQLAFVFDFCPQVPSILLVVWSAAYFLPLILRRRNPDLMGALIVVPHLVQLVTVPSLAPGNFVLPFVFYALARYCSVVRGRWWLLAGLAASVAAGLRAGSLDLSGSSRVFAITALTVGCLAVVAASWFMGALSRASRDNIDALRERNAALLGERDQSAKLAVAEERARIAREMHDVVAHSLSLIVVQTDGAAYVAGMDGDPAAQLATARSALETIGATARQALSETRRLVGVLQDDDEPEFSPQATLAQIPALVDRVRAAGFSCTLTIPDDHSLPALLGRAAQAAAYRIVQESLTNVMKHAGPGTEVAVILTDVPAGLDILISDNGRGPTEPDGLGHGLIGMRERAQSMGGSFDAHPNPHGGFTVHAVLPPTPGDPA